MKSGLYAWAGASATASAAACANRFDEPITNESKVYFWLISNAGRAGVAGFRHRPRRLDLLLDREPDPPLAAGFVADGGADQIEEMPFDPLAREVVRHREHERVVGELST